MPLRQPSLPSPSTVARLSLPLFAGARARPGQSFFWTTGHRALAARPRPPSTTTTTTTATGVFLLPFASFRLPSSSTGIVDDRLRASRRRWTTGSSTLRAFSSSSSSSSARRDADGIVVYEGPLASTFRRLKLFSLSSLGLCTLFSPFLLIIDSTLPFSARLFLMSTALLTSVTSTALIGWVGKPYVNSMCEVDVDGGAAGKKVLDVYTTDVFLRPLRTTVVEPHFLRRHTNRPFATWELDVTYPSPFHGETTATTTARTLVSETRNLQTGKVIGRIWMHADADADGGEGKVEVKVEGKPVRHFNVHEEVLRQWQAAEGEAEDVRKEK